MSKLTFRSVKLFIISSGLTIPCFLAYCNNNQATTVLHMPITPLKDQPFMQRKNAAVVHLTDNGKAGILEKTTGTTAIYEFPGAGLRSEMKADGSLVKLKLSNSGQTYALQRTDNTLEVSTLGTNTRLALPVPRSTIRDWIISDDGKRFACIRASGPASPEDIAQENGKLEIWHLPFEKSPAVSVSIPVYERTILAGNGHLSTLAVQSANDVGAAAYVKLFTMNSNDLQTIYEISGSPLPIVFPKLSNAWTWTASGEGMIGWNKNKKHSLPGTFRESFIYSPDGRHLLLYRTIPASSPSHVTILFRLYDLENLKEIKTSSHDVSAPLHSLFLLDDDDRLFEIRLEENETLTSVQIHW